MPTVRYGEVVHTNDVPSSLDEKLKKRKSESDSDPNPTDQTKPKLNQEIKRSE